MHSLGATAKINSKVIDQKKMHSIGATVEIKVFKFPGRGQRDTPVTDAEGIIQIIMLLPGRAAAIARQSAANVVVRYLRVNFTFPEVATLSCNFKFPEVNPLWRLLDALG